MHQRHRSVFDAVQSLMSNNITVTLGWAEFPYFRDELFATSSKVSETCEGPKNALVPLSGPNWFGRCRLLFSGNFW